LEAFTPLVQGPAFSALAKAEPELTGGVLGEMQRCAGRVGLFFAMPRELGVRLLRASTFLQDALLSFAAGTTPRPEHLIKALSTVGTLRQMAAHIRGSRGALASGTASMLSDGHPGVSPGTENGELALSVAQHDAPTDEQAMEQVARALGMAPRSSPLLSLAARPWYMYRLGRRLCVAGQHAAAAPLFERVAHRLEDEQQKTWCLALAKAARAEGLLALQGCSALGHASSQLLEGATELAGVANKARRLQIQRQYWRWRARLLQLLADMLALRPEDRSGAVSLAEVATAVQREGEDVRHLMAAADRPSLVLVSTQQRLAQVVAGLTAEQTETRGPRPAHATQTNVEPSEERDSGAATVHAPLAHAVAALQRAVLTESRNVVWQHLEYISTLPTPWPPMLFRPYHDACLQLGLQASSAYGGIGGMPMSSTSTGLVSTVKVGAGTDLVLDLDGLITGLEKRSVIQAQIYLVLTPKQVQLQAGQAPPVAVETELTCEVRLTS
jgi:hypothetical protein